MRSMGSPDDRDCEAPLLELLGIKPCFVQDEDCPEVDFQKLRDFKDEKLTVLVAEDVFASIRLYRNWYQAFADMVDDDIEQP